MASVLDVVRVGTEVVQLYNDYKKQEAEAKQFLNRASLVTRTCIAGIGMIAIGAGVKGSSAGTLANLKGVEVLFQTMNLPVSIIKAIESNDPTLEKIEKGIIAPLAAMARACQEMHLYEAQHILAMSPEEQAKITVPVYEVDPEYYGTESPNILKQVGVKPVDLNELRKVVEISPDALNRIKIAEIVFKVGGVSKGLQIGAAVVKKIGKKLIAPSGENFPRCAITGQPISQLVVPNCAAKVKAYYEKAAFDLWVELDPMTPPPNWPANLLPPPLTINSVKPGSVLMQRYINDEWNKLK